MESDPYRCEPATTPAAGIVLVGPELHATPSARAAADRWCARGFCVSVPTVDTLEDVAVAIATLRASACCNGRVGVVGYEAGGRYAFLGVTRCGADGAAAFSGLGIVEHLDEASRARVPLSLHFGDDDPRVPFADLRRIKGALEGFATTEIYRYPAYDAAAAALAEDRAAAALKPLREAAP